MKTVIVDLDGTLALKGDRDPYDASRAMEDEANKPICELVEKLHIWHYEVVFVSGRFEVAREITEDWISAHTSIFRPKLFLRADGDKRKDAIVKREIYEKEIKPNFPPVLFVLDDRDQCVKMWREIGLTCLQVAEGAF